MIYNFWCDDYGYIEVEFNSNTSIGEVERLFYEWLDDFGYTSDEIDNMIENGGAGYYDTNDM